MRQESTFLAESQEVIDTLRHQLDRVEGRIASLQSERDAIRAKLKDVESAVEVYRSIRGLPKETPSVAIEGYQNLSMRDILRKWARDHGGRVVMKEISHALAPGLFDNSRAAQSTLFRELTRRKAEFPRVSRGVYQLAENGAQQAELPVKAATGGTSPNRLSLRLGALAVLRENGGRPIHSEELLRRMRELGADTTAKRPVPIIDLVVFHLIEDGHKITKVAPHTWVFQEASDQTAS